MAAFQAPELSYLGLGHPHTLASTPHPLGKCPSQANPVCQFSLLPIRSE